MPSKIGNPTVQLATQNENWRNAPLTDIFTLAINLSFPTTSSPRMGLFDSGPAGHPTLFVHWIQLPSLHHLIHQFTQTSENIMGKESSWQKPRTMLALRQQRRQKARAPKPRRRRPPRTPLPLRRCAMRR